MEDTKVNETHSRDEKLRNLIANATEVLKDESDDEVVRVFHQIQENLGKRRARIDVEKSLEPFHKTLTSSSSGMPALFPIATLTRTNGKVSRLDHEAHPMQIDLILKKIFEYCSVDTLMNCRLVCTKWLALSMKSWRRNAILLTDNLIDNGVVEDVIKDGSEFRKNPFERYNVLDYGSEERDFDLKKSILDTFSSSIQYLDLDCDDFELVMSLILSKLPRLRHAKLRFFYDDFLEQCKSRASEGRGCPFQNIKSSPTLRKLQLNFVVGDLVPAQLEIEMIPWRKFFERVPALTHLQIIHDLESTYGGSKRVHLKILTEILKAVKTVRRNEKFTTLNLEELDIMVHTSHSCITIPFPKKISDIILHSRFPLERLHVDLGAKCPGAVWSSAQVLANLGKTLKYLKAISAPISYYLKKDSTLELFIRRMVLLENVTELELLNGCVWSFYFLNSFSFPSLEILRIDEMKLKQRKQIQKLSWKTVDVKCGEIHFKILLNRLHLTSLKRFYYSGPRHFTLAELQLLSKAMPNVTDFGIPLSAKTFPVVCELWPDLTSLRVGQSYDGAYPLLDDYAITGLSPFEINQAKPDRNKNITDLKNLWSFVVDENCDVRYSRNVVITDVSAVYGFLHLPNLCVLRIGGFCKFSPEVRTKLESHLSDIYLNQPQFFEEDRKGDVNSEYSCSSEDESESGSEYSDPDLSY